MIPNDAFEMIWPEILTLTNLCQPVVCIEYKRQANNLFGILLSFWLRVRDACLQPTLACVKAVAFGGRHSCLQGLCLEGKY